VVNLAIRQVISHEKGASVVGGVQQSLTDKAELGLPSYTHFMFCQKSKRTACRLSHGNHRIRVMYTGR